MPNVKSEPATAIDAMSESELEEHEQKVNKYQAELAAYIRAKYFSNKASDGGKIFEEETIIDGETIRSSRWPCTSSYANPVKFLQEKNNHERRDSPSSAADSSAKNDSPSVVDEASPKNNEGVLAKENNLTLGKRQASKETSWDKSRLVGCFMFFLRLKTCNNPKHASYHEIKIRPADVCRL